MLMKNNNPHPQATTRYGYLFSMRIGSKEMGWFGNRLRRGLTNRSYQQICLEVGSQGSGSALFAVAIAEAVYPNAIYGSPEWDSFRSLITRKPVVDKRIATQISEAWLDRREMPWSACIIRGAIQMNCYPTGNL